MMRAILVGYELNVDARWHIPDPAPLWLERALPERLTMATALGPADAVVPPRRASYRLARINGVGLAVYRRVA